VTPRTSQPLHPVLLRRWLLENLQHVYRWYASRLMGGLGFPSCSLPRRTTLALVHSSFAKWFGIPLIRTSRPRTECIVPTRAPSGSLSCDPLPAPLSATVSPLGSSSPLLSSSCKRRLVGAMTCATTRVFDTCLQVRALSCPSMPDDGLEVRCSLPATGENQASHFALRPTGQSSSRCHNYGDLFLQAHPNLLTKTST
jgi:hypothetical protein